MTQEEKLALERAGRSKHNREQPLKPIPKSREQRLRAARRLPQAVVKVASYASGRGRVRATVKYVAREGGLLMEDETGLTLTSWEEIEEVLDAWGQDFGQQGKINRGRRGRDTMHLVLSAPKGADRQAVQQSVRDFAAEQFSGNHQYLFTMHNDTAHPHGHVVIKAKGFDGKYLRTNKEILYAWREQFADKCRAHDIEVDASSRLSRGVGTRGRSLKQIKTSERLQKIGKLIPETLGIFQELGYCHGKRNGNDHTLLPWEQRAKQIALAEKSGLKNEAMNIVKEASQAKSMTQKAKMEKSAVDLLKYVNELPVPKSRREQSVEKAFQEITTEFHER